MKFKLLVTAAMVFGFASVAQADVKVAEYGDPIIGNSYGGCTFNQVYGTGGGNWLYTEYQISCSSGTYKVGVYKTTDPWLGSSCTFSAGSPTYYASGNCSNWRVYLKP